MTVGSRVFGLRITSSLKESRDPCISAFLPPSILALIITRLLDGHCSFVVSLYLSSPIKNPVSLVCHINIALEM